jgi:hypothetical protein
LENQPVSVWETSAFVSWFLASWPLEELVI